MLWKALDRTDAMSARGIAVRTNPTGLPRWRHGEQCGCQRLRHRFALTGPIGQPNKVRRVGRVLRRERQGRFPLSKPWAVQKGTQNSLFRSEEHTSELQSLMRISYAVFCLKKKKQYIK